MLQEIIIHLFYHLLLFNSPSKTRFNYSCQVINDRICTRGTHLKPQRDIIQIQDWATCAGMVDVSGLPPPAGETENDMSIPHKCLEKVGLLT